VELAGPDPVIQRVASVATTARGTQTAVGRASRRGRKTPLQGVVVKPKPSCPATPSGDDRLRSRLTEAEVAVRLQLCKKTLSRARLAGRPLLPYVRLSSRGIRYDAAAVEACLERATQPAVAPEGVAA
jgi:hypothetical protein